MAACHFPLQPVVTAESAATEAPAP